MAGRCLTKTERNLRDDFERKRCVFLKVMSDESATPAARLRATRLLDKLQKDEDARRAKITEDRATKRQQKEIALAEEATRKSRADAAAKAAANESALRVTAEDQRLRIADDLRVRTSVQTMDAIQARFLADPRELLKTPEGKKTAVLMERIFLTVLSWVITGKAGENPETVNNARALFNGMEFPGQEALLAVLGLRDAQNKPVSTVPTVSDEPQDIV